MKNIIFIKKHIRETLSRLSLNELAQDLLVYENAKKLVGFFYVVLVIVATFRLNGGIGGREGFNPLWPVWWAENLGYSISLEIVSYFFLIASIIGATFYWNRLARIIAFIGIMQFHALESSFVQPNHQYYPFLYVALILIFLPGNFGRKNPSLELRKNFLLVLLGAQAMTMLTYSMSGVGKLVSGITALAQGRPNIFQPEGMSLQLAEWLPKIGLESKIGELIIDNPILSAPLYPAATYLELFALWAVFRPSLQKLWAFGLVIFHLGTYFTMRIDFLPSILILLILFYDSPFKTSGLTWKDTLYDLPIFGLLIRKVT